MAQNKTSKDPKILRERDFETVLEIIRAISRTLSLDKILDLACKMTGRALGVERCSIGMVTGKDNYEITHRYRAEPFNRSPLPVNFDLAQYPHLRVAYFGAKPIHLFDMNKRSVSSAERGLFRKLNIKVFLGVPILVGGEVLGALHPSKVTDSRPFSPFQIRLCQTIANQVGIAMRNARLVNDLNERYRQQRLVHNLSKSFFEILDIQKLFDRITGETCKVLLVDRCAIASLDQDRAELVIRSIYHSTTSKSSAKGKIETSSLALKFKLSNFRRFYQEILEKGLFVTHSILASPLGKEERKYLKTTGIKSLLMVPIFSGSRVAEVLYISTVRDYRSFTDSEIKLCQTIANLASLALENAKLVSQVRDQGERMRRQFKEQEILLNVSQALSRTSSLPKLLETVTRETAELLGIERIAAALIDENTGDIFSYTAFPDSKHQTELKGAPENMRNFPVLMGYFRRRRVFCASDILRSKLSPSETDYFKKRGIKSILEVPFTLGHRVLGVLGMDAITEHRDFSESEIRLSQAIASQVSVAIENARLIEALKKRSAELRALSLEVINAQEKEKKHIAGDLHDLVAQDLSAVLLNLKLIQKAQPGDYAEVQARARDSGKLLSASIADLRNLTSDLRPPVLDDLGLTKAVEWYVRRFQDRSNVKITLKIEEAVTHLPPEITSSIYRMIQEGLANVARHSQASLATVSIGQENHNICVTIQDNGIGFDLGSLRLTEGYGLFRLKETAGLLGGKLEILSRPRRGTTLIILLPW